MIVGTIVSRIFFILLVVDNLKNIDKIFAERQKPISMHYLPLKMQEINDQIPEHELEEATLKFKKDCVSQIYLWAIYIAISLIHLILRLTL